MPKMPTKGEWLKMPWQERLGDQPIEEALRQKMHDMAHTLDRELNDGATGPDRPWGYVVMTFPYGDRSGRCNYISNGADRKMVVTLMKEMIARFEGQPEIEGHG